MTKNEQVMQWIRDNFDMEHITIEKTDILPYGHMIKDQEGGHMIAFYDLLYDRVDYRFQMKGGVNVICKTGEWLRLTKEQRLLMIVGLSTVQKEKRLV